MEKITTRENLANVVRNEVVDLERKLVIEKEQKKEHTKNIPYECWNYFNPMSGQFDIVSEEYKGGLGYRLLEFVNNNPGWSLFYSDEEDLWILSWDKDWV